MCEGRVLVLVVVAAGVAVASSLRSHRCRDERPGVQDPRAAPPQPADPESRCAQAPASGVSRGWAFVRPAGAAARTHPQAPSLLDLQVRNALAESDSEWGN